MKHEVIVQVRAIRGGKALDGIEVTALDHPVPNKGITGSDGRCVLLLEEGVWTFRTAPEDVPGPPPRHFRAALGGGKRVPLRPGQTVLLEPLDPGIDCVALTKRLKKRMVEGEYTKALALIQRIKASNNDYNEVPQLQIFVHLETLLGKAMAGEDIASALEGIVIRRFRWKKAE